ncbi:MAG: hypothetical protein ACFFCZ_19130 [Promethearchaeota archaeon]
MEKIRGKLFSDQIRKYLGERHFGDLNRKELGEVGKIIAKELILPDIPNIHNICSINDLDLEKITGVPFHIAAKYGDTEIWLVQVKTSRGDYEGSPRYIQKSRMRQIKEFLEKESIMIRPVIIQILLSRTEYIVRDFPLNYKKAPLDTVMNRIQEFASSMEINFKPEKSKIQKRKQSDLMEMLKKND